MATPKRPKLSTVTCGEPPANQPISVSDINPLLGGLPVDTIHRAQALLSVLEQVELDAGLVKGFNEGMGYLLWLVQNSLQFAMEHPDVEHVLLVKEEAEAQS